MSAQRRALTIGLMGPAIQSLGLVWLALHLAAAHWHGAFTLRHIAFEPGVLLILVGLALSIVLTPVAIDVARAQPEELDVPLFGVDDPADVQGELWPDAGSGAH